jgi:hypothetical protein
MVIYNISLQVKLFHEVEGGKRIKGKEIKRKERYLSRAFFDSSHIAMASSFSLFPHHSAMLG